MLHKKRNSAPTKPSQSAATVADMSAPQLLGYSGDRAQFEKFANSVNERTRADPSTARKLALDFSLVACGGRRCFMNDFAPNVTTDTLATLIEDAKAAYGPIAHGLIVVTLRSVDFVIQSRSWYQTKGQSTLVDASEKELLVHSSRDDETQNTLDAIFEDEIKKSVSEGDLKVNFDVILDQSAYSEARSMSGPTFAGLLLNYPCVYRFTTEHMDDAARLLSTLDLQQFTISCKHSSIQGFDEGLLVCAFTIPSRCLTRAVQVDFNVRVSEWEASIRTVAKAWGFDTTCVSSLKSANSLKVVF